jgi:hypothetical protein
MNVSAQRRGDIEGILEMMMERPGQFQKPVSDAFNRSFAQYTNPVKRFGGISQSGRAQLQQMLRGKKGSAIRQMLMGRQGIQQRGREGIIGLMKATPSPADVMNLLNPEITSRQKAYYDQQATEMRAATALAGASSGGGGGGGGK